MSNYDDTDSRAWPKVASDGSKHWSNEDLARHQEKQVRQAIEAARQREKDKKWRARISSKVAEESARTDQIWKDALSSKLVQEAIRTEDKRKRNKLFNKAWRAALRKNKRAKQARTEENIEDSQSTALVCIIFSVPLISSIVAAAYDNWSLSLALLLMSLPLLFIILAIVFIRLWVVVCMLFGLLPEKVTTADKLHKYWLAHGKIPDSYNGMLSTIFWTSED